MKTFYVTTPIYYVNSEPHVGSAYTTLHADLLARFYRLNGYNVRFLTGTDEHGQKIEQSAQKLNQAPLDFVDDISQKFKDLIRVMDFSPDYFETINGNFIRTTMDCHKSFVQDVWRKMVKNDWLYEGSYEGWYCVSDEAYYGEDELIKCEDGKLRTMLGKEAEWRQEKTYFFRLGEFQKILLKIYDKIPHIIRPLGKKTEAISFVSGLSMKDYDAGVPPRENYLQDLSVSRNTFDWGVRIPCDLKGKELLDADGNWKKDVPQNERHVIYVWFDALFNYLTALGCGLHDDYKNFWLNNKNKVHLIGKDILRPHGVYWIAFLLAYNYTREQIARMDELDEDVSKFLPTTVYAHGWLTNEGQKISKSLGNAIIPYTEIEWMHLSYDLDNEIARDYLKYYLITTTPFGNDGDYSRTRFIEKINGDLANKVGNLTKRTLDMIYKNCGGKIPVVSKFEKIFKDNISVYEGYIADFDFVGYVDLVMKIAESANKYMDDKAPWKLFKDGKKEEAEIVLYSIANAIKRIGILLQPICPYIAEKMLEELGLRFDKTIPFSELDRDLEFGRSILEPSIIIPRMQSR